MADYELQIWIRQSPQKQIWSLFFFFYGCQSYIKKIKEALIQATNYVYKRLISRESNKRRQGLNQITTSFIFTLMDLPCAAILCGGWKRLFFRTRNGDKLHLFFKIRPISWHFGRKGSCKKLHYPKPPSIWNDDSHWESNWFWITHTKSLTDTQKHKKHKSKMLVVQAHLHIYRFLNNYLFHIARLLLKQQTIAGGCYDNLAL